MLISLISNSDLYKKGILLPWMKTTLQQFWPFFITFLIESKVYLTSDVPSQFHDLGPKYPLIFKNCTGHQ